MEVYDSLNDDDCSETDYGSGDWKLPNAFNQKRHLEKLEKDKSKQFIETWRLKERVRINFNNCDDFL